MKPFLSRPQHTFYRRKDYFEVDIDCHRFSYIARNLGNMILECGVERVVWDLAWVIQAETDDEMPERILGARVVSRKRSLGLSAKYRELRELSHVIVLLLLFFRPRGS